MTDKSTNDEVVKFGPTPSSRDFWSDYAATPHARPRLVRGRGLGIFVHGDHASQQGIELSWPLVGRELAIRAPQPTNALIDVVAIDFAASLPRGVLDGHDA